MWHNPSYKARQSQEGGGGGVVVSRSAGDAKREAKCAGEHLLRGCTVCLEKRGITKHGETTSGSVFVPVKLTDCDYECFTVS